MTVASHPWAAEVIAGAWHLWPIPSYGTPEFLALPQDDPRRLPALVIAAECWWNQGRPEVMAEVLEDHLAEMDAEARYRFRALSWDLSGAQDWNAVAARPTFAELEQRRRSA